MAVIALLPTPRQSAPTPSCCGDSPGSRPGALSRASSFQIRGANGLAGRPRRAPGRPSVTRVIPGARVLSVSAWARDGLQNRAQQVRLLPPVPSLHPRSRAQSALSDWSTPRVTHDARHLLDLATACEQAADPILQSATEMESVVAASPGWPGISSAAADRLARGLRLKDAAQHLREDAADTELHAFLTHRAAGGDVILVPLSVVVGSVQDPSAPANDRWSWRSVAARLFGRA